MLNNAKACLVLAGLCVLISEAIPYCMEKSAFEHNAPTWRQQAFDVSRRCGAGFQEAEDIAQDVMLRLWQMHEELERHRSLDALVSLMARHLTLNSKRRQPQAELDESKVIAISTGPHEELVATENEAWLERRLSELPTTQRTLLYMRQVDRKSHEEIARLLGIEQSSVSTLLARARRTLLEEIKRRNQT